MDSKPRKSEGRESCISRCVWRVVPWANYSEMKAIWLLLLVDAAVACSDKTADTCTVDDDCRYLNSCTSSGCCSHKELMPLKGPEAGGTIIVFFISGMANAGGVGGGPIMTAVEILTFYFNTKQAIPLSQVVIAAGAFIGLMIRVLMRHPTKNRPLLEYHVSMLIIPPILFGSLFGAMINKIIPTVAILSMLTVVLIFITLMTLKNGIKLYKAESKARKETKESPPTKSGMQNESETPNVCIPPMDADIIESELIEKAPLNQDNQERSPSSVPGEGLPSSEQGEPKVEIVENKAISAELEAIYKREARQFPIIPWCWIVFVVAYVIIGLIIRGGSKGKSPAGLEFCGTGFKVFYALWSLGLLIMTFVPFVYLLRLKKTYDRVAYDYDEQDIRWTVKGCTQVYIAGLAGGFLGTMLGFGASLLVAPILVQWRLRAPIIGPTAALMTLIGSAISVIQYAIQGNLNGEYAGWLALIALLGSLAGVLGVTHIVRKLGRPSYLVMVLAVVLGIAMVIVPVYLILDSVKKEMDGKADYKLKDYCS